MILMILFLHIKKTIPNKIIVFNKNRFFGISYFKSIVISKNGLKQRIQSYIMLYSLFAKPLCSINQSSAINHITNGVNKYPEVNYGLKSLKFSITPNQRIFIRLLKVIPQFRKQYDFPKHKLRKRGSNHGSLKRFKRISARVDTRTMYLKQ